MDHLAEEFHSELTLRCSTCGRHFQLNESLLKQKSESYGRYCPRCSRAGFGWEGSDSEAGSNNGKF